MSAGLDDFAPARVDGAPAQALASGASAIFEVAFPLPDGKEVDDLDMAGLNLSWAVEFGAERVTTSVTFERRPELQRHWGWYDDPFWFHDSRSCLHVGAQVGFARDD